MDDQVELFGIDAYPDNGARRMEEARAARDAAVKRVTKGADPEWLDTAYEALLRVRRTRAWFTTDDVWAQLDAYDVPRPREPRAMAPVMNRAKREGLITPTDRFRNSSRKATHANPKRIWAFI